jgi:hypothetical protein
MAGCSFRGLALIPCELDQMKGFHHTREGALRLNNIGAY